jgi:hypothetical protein
MLGMNKERNQKDSRSCLPLLHLQTFITFLFISMFCITDYVFVYIILFCFRIEMNQKIICLFFVVCLAGSALSQDWMQMMFLNKLMNRPQMDARMAQNTNALPGAAGPGGNSHFYIFK